MGVKADDIVRELSERTLGENWQAEFVRAAPTGGIERVLFSRRRSRVHR